MMMMMKTRSWVGEKRKTVRYICVKMVVQGKGRDNNTERGSVLDRKQGTENGALGNTTGGGTPGRKSVITSDRKERDDK